MKEVKDDKNRWRDIPCSWIGRINIVKMSALQKVIYRFNTVPVKLPVLFFAELEQKISLFVWKHKRPQIFKAILIKINRTGGITFLPSDYTTKLQSSDSMVPAQKIKIDQWKKIERPEINLRIYGHIIFDKGSKNMQ